MTLTGQTTKFTCPLACLESFSNDFGLPYTQESLLRDYPQQCNVGAIIGDEDASGTMDLMQFCNLCDELKFQPLDFHDFRSEITTPFLSSLTPRESVIFFVVRFKGVTGQTHYVRYRRQPTPTTFEIMNPRYGAPFFDTMTWEEFVTWDTWCVRLTAPNAQQTIPNTPAQK